MTAEEMVNRLLEVRHNPAVDYWEVGLAGKRFDSAYSEGRVRQIAQEWQGILTDALRLLLWEALFVPAKGTEWSPLALAELDKVLCAPWVPPQYEAGTLMSKIVEPLRAVQRSLLAYVCELLQLLAHARQDNGWEDGRRAGLRQGAEEMREKIATQLADWGEPVGISVKDIPLPE